MARKKINMIQLHSWQECDEALRAIGEHTRDVRAVENVMNEQIAAAKAAATDKVRPPGAACQFAKLSGLRFLQSKN